jgi:hypothetical protein
MPRGALRWELVETPARVAGAEPVGPLLQADEPTLKPAIRLNPSTGFPTVASGSGLVWELAPSPASSQNLVAIVNAQDSLGRDANSQPAPGADVQPGPGLIEAPAPLRTASGLRWELVDDPNAVLAEQPDPETLTTPAALRYQPPYLVSPYIGGGVPSAYVAGWGDFYISGSAATPGKLRDGVVDGSFNTGIGLGDADRFVAIEVDWGIGSIKNFNFNGGFSGAIGRNLINNENIQLAVSGGIIEFYEYGNEEDTEPPSPYGALSLTVPLRPNNPIFQQRLQLTVGGGGPAFGWLNENTDGTFDAADGGFFAAMGVEITRNTGISAAWSGRGVNANFSYVPFRDIPISVNVLAADVFNNSPFGRVGVLSVTWGSNFANGVF